ncbi:unnamed protein product [Arabis nemorensis]|uniref:Uncharacterized protein n=1 Tax=Arabis nemorensis TaxID=586526 RepID=A0A565BNT6_9BRAS|nr:unnamed protein product [Arabis nemorensis]
MPIANLDSSPNANLCSGIRHVKGVVVFVMSNKWRVFFTLIMLSVGSIVLMYFLYKLLFTDSVLAAMALSSAATAIMIFMSIASIIRRGLRFVFRRA